MTTPSRARIVGSRSVALASVLAASLAAAEQPLPPPRPSHNLYGITGLVDMPTADMQPDGQISFTTSYFGGFLRNTLSAQFLPGVEATFRYSILEETGGTPVKPTTLFDRSFDIKVRLIAETERWPALAIGLQDFLGTGVYSSEYVVLTKGIDAGEWGSFRVTGGLGWGRYADSGGIPNPLRGLDPRFGARSRGSELGGTVSIGQFFRGERMGPFAGIEWLTPIDNLIAKFEYSGDQYLRETSRGRGDFSVDIPFNFGLEYRPLEGIEIGAYYMYGDTVGLRVSLSGNPFRPLTDADDDPPPLPVLPRRPLPNGAQIAGLGETRVLDSDAPITTHFHDQRLASVVVHTRLGSVRWAEAELASDGLTCPDDLAPAIDAQYGVIDLVSFNRPDGSVLCTVALRPAGEHALRLTSRVHGEYPVDWFEREDERARVVEALGEMLESDEIGLLGVELAPRRVSLYIENRKYFATPRALGRAARALTRTMPASVEIFEITPVRNSIVVSTIVFSRSQLEDQAERPDAAIRTFASAEVREATPINLGDVLVDDGIFPRFNWTITPAVPLNMFDPDEPLRADLQARVHASVEFLPGLSVNTTITKRIVGQLDEIRRGSGSRIEPVRSLVGSYLREGDPSLSRLSLDYVTKFSESLYGKVSAGYLEWMYGGVAGEVLWKPVDQSWGLGLELAYVKQRNFDQRFGFRDYSTVTGHASVYWNTGFYGLSTQIDAGRYLAGDWGATFTLKRRFGNGWELGGFFTLTDVPFEDFGEGSFDKGIFLTIPFNWIVPFETTNSYTTLIRPLTRDGGQRVSVPNPLWSIAESVDRNNLRTNWEGFWE